MEKQPKLITNRNLLGIKLTTAWAIISGMILLIFLGLIFGIGSLNGLLFPLSFLIVGYVLYRKFPHMYVSFALWSWFIGAVIYRLIEYRGTNTTLGDPITVPRLVTAISLLTLIRHLPTSIKNGGIPFLMCSGSICYGLALAFVHHPQNFTNPVALVNSILLFLGWIGPIAFGFHLFVNWRDYPIYRQTILKTYLWCVIILGTYGLWQYFATPAWDTLDLDTPGREWMGGQDMESGLRVWSTMSQSYGFTFNFFPGLLLLFVQKEGPLRYIGFGIGSFTFLLSRVRTSWLAFSITFLCFFASNRSNQQLKIIISAIVFIVFIAPFFIYFNDSLANTFNVITSRFDSFSNPEDGSLLTRQRMYAYSFTTAVSEIIGKGIIFEANPGFTVGENGIMEILTSLGWFGTIFFGSGLISMLALLFRSPASRSDIFFIASRSIVIGSLGKMFISSFLFDEFAIPVWGFLGFSLAGHYHAINRNRSCF